MIRIFTTTLLAATLTASLATAKGHDQAGNVDNDPGANTGVETVTPAKTLGATRGNGKKPAGPNGKSADAGRPN